MSKLKSGIVGLSLVVEKLQKERKREVSVDLEKEGVLDENGEDGGENDECLSPVKVSLVE